MRQMRIITLCLLLALAAAWVFCAEAAPVRDNAGHNYIFIFLSDDDPGGLRFDAARLACENVMASAAVGSRGQLGLIVDRGADHYLKLGAVDMALPPETMESAIGVPLAEAAEKAVEGDSKNITAALVYALNMVYRFDPSSETSVILVSGDQEVLSHELISVILSTGARLYQTDPSEGSDLNARLLHALIRAESDVNAPLSVSGRGSLTDRFQVPYAGIACATVNVSFPPEASSLIESVAVTSPDGQSFTLWDADGLHQPEGIAVREGDSFLMASVPAPTVGEWTVSVSAADDAPVSLVARLCHGVDLAVELDSYIDFGAMEHVSAWFRNGDGDLTDSDIYSQSEATLELYAPGAQKPSQALEMTLDGDRFTADFSADPLGIWSARVVVRNPWLQARADHLAFEVITPPTPTPRPRPTPSPVPTPVPVEVTKLEMNPSVTAENGDVYLEKSAENVTFKWEIEGETESVEAVLLEGEEVIQRRVRSGRKVDASRLKDNAVYTLRITATPKYAKANGAEPLVKTLSFRFLPEVVPVNGITLSVEPLMPPEDEIAYVDRAAEKVTVAWEIDGESEDVQAELLAEGDAEPLITGLHSGESFERSLLEDDRTYTLQVSAMPKNGGIIGEKPVVETLAFKVYPEAQPIEGLTLAMADAELKDDTYQLKSGEGTLIWRMESGAADHYQLLVTDPNGGMAIQQTVRGNASSYPMTFDQKGTYQVTLIATPRYATSNDMNISARLNVRPRLPGFLQKYWYLVAAGAVLLVALIVVLLVVKDKTAKRVVGAIRIASYDPETAMNTLVVFNKDGNSVKVNAPITKHPTLAKLKGKKAYTLLSRVRASMSMSDASGNAPGGVGSNEVQHRANTALIALTCTDAKTRKSETCFVGRYDMGYSTLHIEDGGKTYTFLFCDSKSILPPTPPEKKEPEPEPEPEPVIEAAPEQPSPSENGPTPTAEDLPPTDDTLTTTGDDASAEEAPNPADDELPPADDDLPPADDELPPANDDLPPANDYFAAVSSFSSDDALPPANDDLPPANDYFAAVNGFSSDDDLPPIDDLPPANDYYAAVNGLSSDEDVPPMDDLPPIEEKKSDPDEPKPFFM